MRRRSSILFLLFIVTLVSAVSSFGLSAAQSENETVVIPVRITLLVPGSLTVVFPWTDNVTASASSAKHSDYTLLTRQNYVVFTTNASDTFKIKIIVSYPAFNLYEFTVRAYSHNALSDYLVTFTLNCSVVMFDIDLTTAPAPRYPTAEEIAEAQSKYVAGLLEQLANSTEKKVYSKVQSLLENYTSSFNEELSAMRGEFKDYVDDLIVQVADLSRRMVEVEHSFKSLSGEVDDLKNGFSILVKKLDEEILKLKSALESFQANTWTSIVIVSCVFVGGLIGAVKMGQSGPVIAEISAKGLSKKPVKAKGKAKKTSNVDDHHFPNKIIFIVIVGVLLYFFFIMLFSP